MLRKEFTSANQFDGRTYIQSMHSILRQWMNRLSETKKIEFILVPLMWNKSIFHHFYVFNVQRKNAQTYINLVTLQFEMIGPIYFAFWKFAKLLWKLPQHNFYSSQTIFFINETDYKWVESSSNFSHDRCGGST